MDFINKIKNRFSNSNTLKASLVLVFWMFVSRGMGVVRTALVGKLPTSEADIFNSGLVLQSNLITIFILGSIIIATLPQVTKLSKFDKEQINKDKSTNQTSIYLSWCMLILSVLLSIISIFLIIFSEPVLWWFNFDLMNSFQKIGKLHEFIAFNQIALIGPVIFGLKSLFGVFLNVKKEYFIYSLEGVINNFGSLLGLTIGFYFYGILGAGIGVLAGSTFALLAFIFDAYRFGFTFSLGWFEGLDSYLWQTLWLYLPRLLVYSNIRAAETMVTILSPEANGQISAFQYALDIQGIFLGIIMVVATVFLPNLAQILVDKGKNKVFWDHLFKYLKVSFWLSIFGAFVTILGTPLALWLFKNLAQVKNTSFLADPKNIELVTQLAILCAVSLVFQAIAEILNRYFTAIEKVWQTIIASTLGNFSAIILAFLLHRSYGAGVTTSLALALNSFVLCLVLAYFTYKDWKNSSIILPS